MARNKPFGVRSEVLKDRVNSYAVFGLGLAIASIIISSILVSYQITGYITFSGILLAQKSNPALWFLDITPFMFAYWGQLFFYDVASSMESIIEDKTRDLVNKSNSLELKLQYETNHDHLTNLPNARLFTQRISQGLKQVNKGEQLAVILIHINLFKDINLKFGNFNANSLLVQFAENLKTVLLEPYLLQAYMGMNMVARLQGAEFAVLIPRLRKDHDFNNIISKLLESTSTKFLIDGNSVKIATTAGIAVYPLHGEDDSSLLQHASASLFYAEKEGLPFAVFEEGMGKTTDVNQGKIKELQTAIDHEEVSIFYQPLIELKTKSIVGVEPILHFKQDEDQAISDEQIVSMFDNMVVHRQLTMLMLKKAIAQLVIWHQAEHKVCASVSVYDPTDRELPAFIDNLLKENDLSPEYLKLELTEKMCLSDQSRSVEVLRKLSELGIKIVISDFCSGYTSFIYLTVFPISEVKIDKSFIMNMMTDEKKLHIVAAAIKVAETLNIVVIADGVTNKAMMEKLEELGCLYAEGPHFSPAVSADDMTNLLNQ